MKLLINNITGNTRCWSILYCLNNLTYYKHQNNINKKYDSTGITKCGHLILEKKLIKNLSNKNKIPKEYFIIDSNFY